MARMEPVWVYTKKSKRFVTESKRAMCIITKQECDEIRNSHLSYLKKITTNAQDMVYGDTGGKFDIHQRRLGAEKLAPVVAALEQLLDNIEQYKFVCFEDVYREVRNQVVVKGGGKILCC